MPTVTPTKNIPKEGNSKLTQAGPGANWNY